jgi:hypothetical protein
VPYVGGRRVAAAPGLTILLHTDRHREILGELVRDIPETLRDKLKSRSASVH